MSSQTATRHRHRHRHRSAAPARRADARPQQPRSSAPRRRLLALAAAAFVGLGAVAVVPHIDDAAKELALPLRHEDVIRQQAAAKSLDPALVAGVIYTESKFVDQTSSAGARGLMQITPETARGIAQRTGGTRFTEADLAGPQVNISYGAWYLRHLLDRYDGDEVLALAAYNGGQGNVNRWLAASGGSLRVSEIPFAETRGYVERVMDARADYRREYRRELGL